MIAGLPLSTWVLIFAATVPGLALVLIARRIHRDGDRMAPEDGAAAPRGDGGAHG